MSPLLKALGVGVGAFAGSLLIMYGISRFLNRPFFPRLPERTVSPTPVQLIPE